MIKNSFLSVLTDWNRNYCFQEGFHSIIRCLLGILLIIFYNKKYKRSQVNIEFLTFSVIPNLTKIWLRNIKSLDIRHPFRITIGDCSGGLRKKNHDTKVKVFPIANIEHGEKLDLFINNICNAEFIVVCDDDIFFINPEGLNWAIKKLKNNKNLAVVTLAPRNHKTNWVRNTEFLMGSYCLVIRTKIWINEGLSFQQVKPKGWRKIGNFFDTADYANNQLIIKGYDIIKVSKSQKNNIIMFTSLSLWGLRIQMSNGYINYIIRERPHEYEKAYMTAIILSRMNKFINSIHSYEQYTISERSISRTINICKNKIKKSRMNAILEDLEHKFTMLGI